MSRFWKHSPYAEDQPYPHAILATHVLFRGFQSGSGIGPFVGIARYLLLRRRSLPGPLLPIILRSTGVGAAIGTGVSAVGLMARMWGREEIEWRDRSWRLLENKGQVEVDTWGYLGVVVGVTTFLATRKLRGVGWRTAVGSMGLGSTCGVVGYMIYRHGIKGGHW